MSFWRHPLFLLTKTLLQERKRRIYHTIWEIISGLLFFVVLILMRQLVKHTDDDYELTEKTAEDRLDYVVYCPKTALTDDFMPIVIGKLSTKPHLYSTGFYNKQEMNQHLRINDNKTKAVVYFRVFNETIPHLDYTIGLINDYSQYNRNFMTILTAHPMNAKQHATLPLMELQWAIDQSFMKYATGYTVNHNVSFPDYQKLHLLPPAHPLDTIYNFLLFCTMIAPLPSYLYNHSRLVLERRSGLKELMRIMGITPTALRCSHYLDSVLLSVINSILITIMLKITGTPILPRSNFFIIVLTMILHSLTITSMAFVTSIVGQGYEQSNGLALVTYITCCALCIFWYDQLHSWTFALYVGCFLLPHAPVSLFWDEVKYMENADVGLNFGNIANQHPSIFTVIPVAYTWLAFICQMIVVWILVWYLDMVIPGVYGVAQRRNFFIPNYWTTRKKVHFNVTSERKKAFMHDDRFFQKPPNLPVAIKLVHVSKLEVTEYTSVKYVNHILNDINLDIYRGEITVVLGVEGSGKSTLVSVITGMTKATVGNIYVNGYDTTMFLRTIQKELGYCPQQHLTFAYLTVEENITLFEQLRGIQKEEQTSTEELMTKLRLKSKADMFSHQLTPSAERCLQVACALAGGADILILDEPTSNCDSETRHYLWDIIMELRGQKTIVMTTSSIEEADAVGDRIALFTKGRIKCHGTPKFLKNAIGTGFNLSVTLKKVEGADAVRALVEDTLHDAVTTKIDPKRLLFTLPAKDHELLPDLFDALEEQKEELGIANMGVGMSLEEMFLGFIEDTIEDAVIVETYHGYQQLTGWRLHVQQIGALMKRNFEHMWNYKYQFTILQIIVPVLGLIIISVTTNSYHPEDPESKTITLLIDPGERRFDNFEAIRDMYPKLHVLRTHGHADITDRKNEPVHWPEKNIIKFVMGPDKSDLYIGLYSLPEATKALNTFSNIYISDVVPELKPPVISLSAPKHDFFIPKETILCMFWAIGVTLFSAIPLIKFIELMIYEHRFLVRYTHRAVGTSNFIHWFAKLLAQMILFLIVIPPAVILCASTLDTEETFTEGEFLGVVYLPLLLFLPAFLLQLYGLSFIIGNEVAVSQIYIHSIALGFSGPVIQRLLVELSSVYVIYALQFMSIVGNLCPVFTLSEILTSYTTVARAKSFCLNNDLYCEDLVTIDRNGKILEAICCDPNRKQLSYYSGAPLILLLTFLFHIIFYGFLLVLLQKKKIHILCERIVNANYTEPKFRIKDMNVINESLEVHRMMNCVKNPRTCLGERPPDDTLLVDNMHKKFCYCGLMTARITNVKGVSFKVKSGDSLVLLGPHACGKKTLLYMVTGTTAPTRGDCYIGGTSLQDQRSKFVDKLALSIGGMDKFSTGYINLKRLCMLHGLRSGDAALFTVNCMAYMGLEALMHVPVSAYNPGSSRRLGLCVALLSAPPVVLVDEVMQQLEPHTRPLVRRALASLRSRGCAIVMSEHSVQWRDLDSLDTRIGVMHEGHLIALGSIEHVRKLLAVGHMARLKLRRKEMSKSSELKKELTDGEINQYLKFQSKRKSKTVGLNIAKSGDSSSIDKDKSKAKRKNKISSDFAASKEESDMEYMDVHSKLAKAKVDVAYSQCRKLQTIEEDDSSDSIQVEVREIPVEENVEPENNGKNEDKPGREGSSSETDKASVPNKKDEAANVQSAEEGKNKTTPDQKDTVVDQNQQLEGVQNIRAAANVQSAEEGKNKTTPGQKDEVVDQNQQLEGVQNIRAAANVQSAEEGKNKTTPDQKDTVVDQNQQLEGVQNIRAAANVQSAEEGKNKTTSGQKDKVDDQNQQLEGVQNIRAAANVHSAEEGKNNTTPDQKDKVFDQNQQLEGVQNISAAAKVQSAEEGKNNTTPDQKDKVVDQNQQVEGVQSIRAEEKPGDTDKSTTASKMSFQNEDQAGSSRETDKAATLADKKAKEEKKRTSSDEIFLAYENPLHVEESDNLFEFQPSRTLSELKRDFKIAFPTSHLAEEHLSMLYFYIKTESEESKMQYSTMFSKLEHLKSVYNDLIEDYTLSEISIDDVYCHLETELTGYKQIKFDSYD